MATGTRLHGLRTAADGRPPEFRLSDVKVTLAGQSPRKILKKALKTPFGRVYRGREESNDAKGGP